MADARSRSDDQLQNKNKWKKDKDQVSSERTKLRIQTTPENPYSNTTSATKVPVIYFLSREGHLDHPHFVEVPLSSTDGLYLSDFTNRLNILRGKGFSALYSWSFKRSYKNSFVWHDLAENELIYPSRGSEYILKGSELPDSTPRLLATSSFSSSPKPIRKLRTCSTEDSSAQLQHTWATNDSMSETPDEYRVYKSKTEMDAGELPHKPYSHASTQTDDRGTRTTRKVREHRLVEIEETQTTDLTGEDLTLPPSDSSLETLGALIKANQRLMLHSDLRSKDLSTTSRTCTEVPRGIQRVTSFLMPLVSCGSHSFKIKTDGLTSEGFSLVAPYKASLVRRAGDYQRETQREI